MVIKKNRIIKINVILIMMLFMTFITLQSINCFDSFAIMCKAAVETGGTCSSNGNVGVQDGVITEYGRQVCYESGFTDADIAQWEATAASNKKSNSSSDDTLPENNSNQNNKEESVKEKTKSEKEEYSDDEIESAWTETDRVESTCVMAGYVNYTNSLTGETKSEELPLAEHKYAETERKEATCTESGSITYTCEVCGDTYTEEIPALNHEYEWATTKEATLFTSGEEQYICKNCGNISETRVLSSRFPKGFVLVVASILFVIGIGFMTYRKNKSSIS